MSKLDVIPGDVQIKKSKGTPLGGGFGNLFVSTTVASFGGSVSAVAVSWIVYYFTHNALYISYLGMAGIVPGIVLGLFAGVIADRYDKKLLMVASDVVRAISMALLALFLYFVGFSFPLILAVMVIVYSFTTFFQPASQAILPMLINKEGLENANGKLQGSFSVFQSIGSAAGGLIVAYFGAVYGLGINSMTYAVSAIFLFQIAGEFKNRTTKEQSKQSSFSNDLRDGMRFMREHLSILEGTLGGLPANFFGSLFYPFFVVYASDRFGANSSSYGYLVAAIGGGMAFGAILVGRINASRNAGPLISLAILVAGATAVLFALSNSLYLSLVLGALVGVMFGLINTTYISTVQAIVPRELLARVLSIDSVGSFIAIPAGLAVGGVLISVHGIVFDYLVAGVGLLINGVVLLSLKEFRKFKYIP
jgi:DHA3 family tetracycline resistance protein-like MFS transporter